LKSTFFNEFFLKEPQKDTDKHVLKSSAFSYVFPWFIEDLWNRCTSVVAT